ncbi:MAG TPA: DALR domain-containing protein, partial [Rhodothermales bacterium]|nr:DALR domain-containing protein [Rhodothermales bacterium]
AIYDETLEAMLDDLNTPIALAVALKGVKLIQGVGDLNGATARAAQQWLGKTNALLGIVQYESAVPQTTRPTDGQDPLAEQVEALIAERTAARGARDFARADALRDEIEALGVELMDTPEGPIWRRKLTV